MSRALTHMLWSVLRQTASTVQAGPFAFRQTPPVYVEGHTYDLALHHLLHGGVEGRRRQRLRNPHLIVCRLSRVIVRVLWGHHSAEVSAVQSQRGSTVG